MSTKKSPIAVLGANFGASFARIYAKHPDVEHVGVCDSNPKRLEALGAEGFTRLHSTWQEAARSGAYDAVHICLPVASHVEPTLVAMKSGKHVACAVPMAMRIEDLRAIVAAQRESGMNYMMMETVAYCWEFFHVKGLHQNGTLGHIQFMRAAHYQDLENLDPAWNGLPPMWYMTHAVAPLLALVGGTMSHVNCMGSGRMRESFRRAYGNPYPIETAIFRIRGTDIAAEITRSMIETAVQYKESFDIYGDKATFLWAQFWGQRHSLLRLDPISERIGRGVAVEPIEPTYPLHLLPEELRPFGTGGHGGSHPHLAHEFIRSIVEERPPAIDAVTAANWCAPGICGDESALRGGELVPIPEFS